MSGAVDKKRMILEKEIDRVKNLLVGLAIAIYVTIPIAAITSRDVVTLLLLTMLLTVLAVYYMYIMRELKELYEQYLRDPMRIRDLAAWWVGPALALLGVAILLAKLVLTILL